MDSISLPVVPRRTNATLDVTDVQSEARSIDSRSKPTRFKVEKLNPLSIPKAGTLTANSVPLPPLSPNSIICFVDSKQEPGLLVTDELDAAIKECRRKVERISKDCRAKNRKFRDIEFDLENDARRCIYGIGQGAGDGDIPADVHKDVLRVTQIFENPHFFSAEGAPNSNDIRQGALGNCWFLSALAIASTARGLIEKVCVDRDEAVGVYGFVFFKNDRWVGVVIDDQLFTRIPKYEELGKEEQELYHDDKSLYNRIARKGGKTLTFARSGENGETWVPLFEKAYAKLHGNYNHLQGGFESEALEDITGGIATFLMTKDILDPGRFWVEELCRANKDRLFGGSVSMASEEMYIDVQGLIANHAYSVLRAVECKGKRFVVIRNPWGFREWTGPWSDGSKEWQGEWLDILPELGHVFGDDGQFVMEYKDFLNTWTDINRTILFDSTWVMTSYWLNVPAAPLASAWTYGDVSFLLYLPEPSATVIGLSQLNARYFKCLKPGNDWSFDFVLVKLGEEKPMAQSNHDWCFSRNVNLEVNLDKGNYIIYVRIARLSNIPIDKVDPLVACGCEDSGCACPAYLCSHSLARVLSDKIQDQAIAKNLDTLNFADYVPADLNSLIQKDLKFYHVYAEKQSSARARAKASVKKSVARFFRRKTEPEPQVMPPVPKQKRKKHKTEGQKKRKGNKKQEGEKIQDDLESKPEVEEKLKKLKTLVKDQDELVVGLRVYTHKDCAAVVVGRLKTDIR